MGVILVHCGTDQVRNLSCRDRKNDVRRTWKKSHNRLTTLARQMQIEVKYERTHIFGYWRLVCVGIGISTAFLRLRRQKAGNICSELLKKRQHYPQRIRCVVALWWRSKQKISSKSLNLMFFPFVWCTRASNLTPQSALRVYGDGVGVRLVFIFFSNNSARSVCGEFIVI